MRIDGSPATAADLELLRRRIVSMSAALGKRPDFYTRVSPERVADLKNRYGSDPKLSDTVYRHVGLTDERRDFIHTASCAKMSGDCNRHVAKNSYKRGDYVDPDDLNRMWEALQEELDAEETDAPRGAERRRPRHPKISLDGLDAGAEDSGAWSPSSGSAAPPDAADARARGLRTNPVPASERRGELPRSRARWMLSGLIAAAFLILAYRSSQAGPGS